MPDDEEYHSTIVGGGLCPMYLQKSGCCFNICCVGEGIHLAPCSLLADIRDDGPYLRMAPTFTART